MDSHGEREADDYQVIRISISWGALSVVAFLLLMGLQIFGIRFFQLRLTQVTVATLTLSIAGFVLGLVGMRAKSGRRAARLGVFLHGTVLFCVFVLVPLTFQVLRRLG